MVFFAYFSYAITMKQVSSQKSNKPSSRTGLKILAVIVSTLVLVIVVYVSIVKIQQRQEAAMFASLKQDFLSLQTEFNKIDPGWKYSEACYGGQEEFNRNVTDSCGVYLVNDEYKGNKAAIEAAESILSDSGFVQTSVNDNSNEFHRVYSTKYDSDIKCSLHFATDNAVYSDASFTCLGSAKSFYFKQID
jgi:hypothetical protein